MISKIFSTKLENEFYTDERCHIVEILNHSDTSSLSIAQARVEPNMFTQLHALNGINEAYYILSGIGEMEINGIFQNKVQPGDVVLIPKGASQRIRNIGEEDLLFLCICTPRFVVQSYRNLED